MHLLVWQPETKSSINADLSLRRALVVFCNSFHSSLELFSSCYFSKHECYLCKRMSDNSNAIHLEMVLFIRRRQLDQSSGGQAADSASLPNVVPWIHLSRQRACRGQQLRLMEPCLIWQAVFHHTAHNHTVPPAPASCSSFNVTKTDDGMTKLFIFRAQNSHFFHMQHKPNVWDIYSDILINVKIFKKKSKSL